MKMKVKLKLNFSLIKLLLILILGVVFMPEIGTQLNPVLYAFALAEILLFGCLLGNSYKNKYDFRIEVLYTLSCVYLLCVMLLNGNFTVGDITRWAKLYIIVMDFILLTKFVIKNGLQIEYLDAFTSLGVIYELINIICILMFPNGMLTRTNGDYFFLGTRVMFIRYFFLFIIPAGLNRIYYKKSKGFWFILLASIFSILKFNVSTAIVCMMILLFCYIFRHNLRYFMNIKIILPITTLLSIAFVSFNAANWFSYLIFTVLKKDLTLTYRTQIWEKALKMITETTNSLIFGHGIVNKGDFVLNLEKYWPAHNQLLQWLFEYGILGTLLVFVFLLYVGNTKDKKMDTYFVCSIALALFIGCITSAYFTNYIGYVCISFLYFIKYFRPVNCFQKDLSMKE